MSDREDDEPCIIHQDPDNLPVDLAELDNPTLSDDELDPKGKHIASVYHVRQLSSQGLVIGWLYD